MKKKAARGGKREGAGRMKRYGDEEVERSMVALPKSVRLKLVAMKGRKMKRTTPRGEEMRITTISDAIVDILDRRGNGS